MLIECFSTKYSFYFHTRQRVQKTTRFYSRATKVKSQNHICTSFNFTLTLYHMHHTTSHKGTLFTEKNLPANTPKDPKLTQKTQAVKISITLIKSTGQTALSNLDDCVIKEGGNHTSAYLLKHSSICGNMVAQWKT